MAALAVIAKIFQGKGAPPRPQNQSISTLAIIVGGVPCITTRRLDVHQPSRVTLKNLEVRAAAVAVSSNYALLHLDCDEAIVLNLNKYIILDNGL